MYGLPQDMQTMPQSITFDSDEIGEICHQLAKLGHAHDVSMQTNTPF
jgi:hypothetical protein